MRRFTLIFAVLLAAGCGDDSGAKETEGAPPGPPDTTAGTTAGTTTGSPGTTMPATTGAEPAEPCCEAEGDAIACSPCMDDALSCSARRTFGETPVAEDFTCETACVASGSVGLWCADDSSCCDAEATCDAQGFCRLPLDETTSGGSGESSSSSTSTGDDDSTSSSSSTGSESTSSSTTSGDAGDSA